MMNISSNNVYEAPCPPNQHYLLSFCDFRHCREVASNRPGRPDHAYGLGRRVH